MYEDPKSKISQLEKVLNARADLVSKKSAVRHELHDRYVATNPEWDDSEFQTPRDQSGSKKLPLSVKVLLGSIIFFLIAVILVAFKFLVGGNIVSGDNIEVTVTAPVSIAGGEVLPFQLEIKNDNNVTLVGADLGINFPVGAKQVENTALEAKRVQTFLGDILPGQSVKKNLSVVLLGEENEKKDITITLEYKVSGSNSLFNKVKTFSVLLSSSPVSIVVTNDREINTNQEVDFTIDVTSNSPTVIRNLLLKVEYPFGFTFKSSNPQTFSQNNLWLLGDLAPGDKRTIKLVGLLNGQEGEERGFNFSLGSQSVSDSLAIEEPLTTYFSPVTIRRPFVSADVSLNGQGGKEIVALAGEKIEATINWQNNLQYEVSDVSITVRLSGNTLDKSSVRVDDGLYRSVDNTIIFNKATNNELASLDPGESGVSQFIFGSFSPGSVTGSGLINPTISLDISVSGRRVDFEGGVQNVLFADSRKVKITSDPQLLAKALYYIGPFQNSGPIPPKAEQETTYTITWTVTNPLNSLSGARVSTILPPYIKWLSVVSPVRESVSYDQGTGLLVWNIGNIPAGAGIISPAKEMSFQVSFLPSVDQISSTPNLTGDVVLSAKDGFTLTEVSSSYPALNINLGSDPYFKVDGEKVIQ